MKTNYPIRREKCCGCKLCMHVCPTGAISFEADQTGASYPVIDETKCIGCKKCEKMCPVNRNLKNGEPTCFAAVHKNRERLSQSASGGVFAAVAENVLKNGGVVYGAAMRPDEAMILRVAHERIDSASELPRLQRSKYVQSDMDGIYAPLAADLKAGRTVFFSGTPCQVAAVKSRFGERENLLLADIICHGVPSQQLFSDYLKTLSKKQKVSDFLFRTKESGWGLCAKSVTIDRKGKRREKRIPCNISSYYKMFLRCETYRSSCYTCPYATKERVGDLTMGDFWGVEKSAETFAECKKQRIEPTQGISCVLVNSEKGRAYLENADLTRIETDFAAISRENGQLTHPSPCPASRERIFSTYEKQGYPALEKEFNKTLGAKKYLILLKNRVSPKLRMRVRKLLGK